MPRRLATLAAVASLVLCAAALARAQSPQELVRKVSVAIRDNAKRITSIEYDYVLKLGPIERHCRYAREGDRFYHASVDHRPDGAFALASEVVWDGKAAGRRTLEEVTRKRKRDWAKPSCSTPDEGVNTYLAFALGLESRADQRYELVSAKQVWDGAEEFVVLEFRAKWLPGRLVSRHTRSLNYSPVSVVLTDNVGQAVYQMSDAHYAVREVAGHRIVYPVRVRSVSHVTGAGAETTTTYEVDERTLRVNQTVAAERFALEPWPNQPVVDLDTRKTVDARDPGGPPPTAVGFPFEGFSVAVAPVAAAPAVVDPVRAREAVVTRGERSWRRAYWSIVCVGVALALVAAGLLLRRHMKGVS